MSENDEDKAYTRVLKVLSELHESWRVYQTQLGSEITEYKKTVNNAISLLATEAIRFQADTTKRLEDDAIERRARQAVVDTATANVRDDMLSARAETLARLGTTETNVRSDMLSARAETLSRLDAQNAQNALATQRAGRKAIAMLSGLGCLLLLVLILIALAIVLVAQNWTPR